MQSKVRYLLLGYTVSQQTVLKVTNTNSYDADEIRLILQRLESSLEMRKTVDSFLSINPDFHLSSSLLRIILPSSST